MNKKDLIYIPLVLLFIVQILDKNEDYLIVQYVLLIGLIIALFVKFVKSK